MGVRQQQRIFDGMCSGHYSLVVHVSLLSGGIHPSFARQMVHMIGVLTEGVPRTVTIISTHRIGGIQIDHHFTMSFRHGPCSASSQLHRVNPHLLRCWISTARFLPRARGGKGGLCPVLCSFPSVKRGPLAVFRVFCFLCSSCRDSAVDVMLLLLLLLICSCFCL